MIVLTKKVWYGRNFLSLTIWLFFKDNAYCCGITNGQCCSGSGSYVITSQWCKFYIINKSLNKSIVTSFIYFFKGFWLIICFIIIAVLVALGIILFCVWKRRQSKNQTEISTPTVVYRANPPYEVNLISYNKNSEYISFNDLYKFFLNTSPYIF